MRTLRLYFIGLFVCISLGLNGQDFDWAKGFGGTSFDEGNSIAVDALGNVYTAGSFQGTADFDPGAGTTNLTAAGFDDIFIQKLDASGNFLWAKSFGNIAGENCSSITVDASGDLYAIGRFAGTVDFDPGTGISNLTSVGSTDAFVMKLDSLGNFIWAKSFGDTLTEWAVSIKTDASGNIYSTGHFQGTVDFDPGLGITNLSSVAASSDIFVQKLDASGNFLWAKSFGWTSADAGQSIAVDASGNVYTTGSFMGTVDFDPGPGTTILNSPSGTEDIFVHKMDASGNFLWAKAFNSFGFNIGTSIIVDSSGDVYTTGRFQATIDFDPGTGTNNLTSVGSTDVFVLKLDSLGNFIWAKSFGGFAEDLCRSIALDDSGNVYTTGSFQGTVDFDPGPGTSNASSAGIFDIFIHKMDPSGNLLWSEALGANMIDRGHSITLGTSGNIYTTGRFGGTVDFDPGAGTTNLSATGIGDAFVLKLSQTIPPNIPTIGLTSNDTICLGDSVGLFIDSGNLNDATDWTWYSGSCGGTLLGTGNTIYVSPTSNTAYFVRGEGGSVTPGSCASVTIVPGTTGNVVSANASSSSICQGETITLTGTGVSNVQWNGGIVNAQATQFIEPGPYQYYVNGTDIFGCESRDSVAFFVTQEYADPYTGTFPGSDFENYVPFFFPCDTAGLDIVEYDFNLFWISFSDIFGFIFGPAFGGGCPPYKSINRSFDAFSGISALRMDADTNGFAEAAATGALFGRPNRLSGYFKTNTTAGDTVLVAVGAIEAGTPVDAFDTINWIGQGVFVSSGATGSYTQFDIPISYSSQATVDSFAINLAFVNNSTSQVGSVWFDAFSFVYDTAVVTICQGDSAFLAGAYQTSAGVYQENLNTIFGCDSTILTRLEVLPAPSLSVSNDTSLCLGETVTLTASGASNITWSGGISNGVAFTPALGANTYTVIGDGGSCGDTVTVNVTVNDNPTVGINSSATTVCVGTNVTLTGTGAQSYAWTGGVNNGVAFSPPVGNNSYVVTGTDANGCSDTSSVSIQVDAAPTPANAGPDQTVCGLSTTLSANAITVGTGQWFIIAGPAGASFNSNSPNATFSSTIYGSYLLEWRIDNGSCPSSQDQVQITFDEAPSPANAGPDQQICGNTTTLAGNVSITGVGTWTQVSGPATASFSNINSASSNITVPSSADSATYSFRWTTSNSSCPSSSDDVDITFYQNPSTANAGPDVNICGTSGTVSASIPNIGTGVWSVVSGPANVTFGDPTSASTSVTASPFGAIPFQAYVLNWTVSNGICPASLDSITVLFEEIPPPPFAGNDTVICGNGTTLFGSNPGVGLGLWDTVGFLSPNVQFVNVSGGQVAFVTIFNLIDSATYTFTYSTISSLNFCTGGTDTVDITFLPNPTAANAGSDDTICGLSANLSANLPQIGSGLWTQISGPGVISFIDDTANITTATASAEGVYNLTWSITSFNCNPSVDTIQLTLSDNPSISNAGADQTICGLNTTLAGNFPTVGIGTWTQVSGPGTATFSNVTDPLANVSSSVSGTYTFEWTITNGSCSPETDQVNITFNESPIAAIDTIGGIEFCQGESYTLNTVPPGSGTYNYQWYDGSSPLAGATNATLSVSTSGSYSVIVEESNTLCADTSQIVTVTVNPRPTVSGGLDTAICAGDLIQLFGSGAVNYSWDNGVTDGVAFVPIATTTYTVIGFDANNCADTATITITVNSLPAVSLGPDTTLCSNFSETITLDAGSGFSSYLWTDGSSSQTLLVDEAYNLANGDEIWVIIEDNNGCEGTDTIDVAFTICGSLQGSGIELVDKIYPNPTSGTLNIELKDNVKTRVRLIDERGAILISDIKEGRAFELLLQDLPAAKYMLILQGDEFEIKTSVIKN